MTWVKCSEQNPNKPGWYWCAYEADILSRRCTSFDFWGGDAWIQQIDGMTTSPTYWMPLPEPPND